MFLRNTLPCRVTGRYSISIDEQIASSVANQIVAFAIVHEYIFTNNYYLSLSGDLGDEANLILISFPL